MNEELGKIRDVALGFEDHGIFGMNIDFDFGGSGQGTGWFYLKGDAGIEYIKRVMQTLSADRFENIKGRTVFVIRDSDNKYAGRIIGFRTLPFEHGGSKTFLFEEVFGPLS